MEWPCKRLSGVGKGASRPQGPRDEESIHLSLPWPPQPPHRSSRALHPRSPVSPRPPSPPCSIAFRNLVDVCYTEDEAKAMAEEVRGPAAPT